MAFVFVFIHKFHIKTTLCEYYSLFVNGPAFLEDFGSATCRFEAKIRETTT